MKRTTKEQQQEIVALYQSGRSGPQISDQTGWSLSCVQNILRGANIPPRTVSEGVRLRKSNPSPPLTEGTVELIDGLLLGDGHISDTGRLSLVQTQARISWPQQVRLLFEAEGLLCSPMSFKGGVVLFRGIEYQKNPAEGFRTRTYKELKRQRDRWYPEGIKRVPKDVRLTPTSIAHWFFGDGTVGGSGYRATFCTDGFSVEDVRLLVRLLNDKHQWNCVRTKRNRIRTTRREDRESLLRMLQPRVPIGFEYKLRLRVVLRPDTIPQDRVKEMRSQGKSYRQIAAALGVSVSGVAGVCQRLMSQGVA